MQRPLSPSPVPPALKLLLVAVYLKVHAEGLGLAEGLAADVALVLTPCAPLLVRVLV